MMTWAIVTALFLVPALGFDSIASGEFGAQEGIEPSPAINVDPDSFWLHMGEGVTVTKPLTITNSGGETLQWTVVENNEMTAQHSHPAGDTVITLSHSESMEVKAENTIVCGSPSGTTNNHFWRTFALNDFGVMGDFNISEVAFGVEHLNAAAPITVNLYTLEGVFRIRNLTLIGTATQELAPQSLALVTVPVIGTALAGSTLVVEIVAPRFFEGERFFPGSNDLGETAPSYTGAPGAGCGWWEPTPYAVIGYPEVQLVMAVAGTVSEPIDCALPDWASVEPRSGSIPGGDSQVVEMTFDSTGPEFGDHTANLCLSSNDPGQPLTVVPLTLTVISDFTPPTLWFEPEQLDFGEVAVGAASPPRTVILHNTGGGAIGLTFHLPDNGFHADTSNCGTFLHTGGYCEIEVGFEPSAAGSVQAILRVESVDYDLVLDVAELMLSGQGREHGEIIFRDRFEQ